MVYLTPLFWTTRWTSAISCDTDAVGVPIGMRQKSNSQSRTFIVIDESIEACTDLLSNVLGVPCCLSVSLSDGGSQYQDSGGTKCRLYNLMRATLHTDSTTYKLRSCLPLCLHSSSDPCLSCVPEPFAAPSPLSSLALRTLVPSFSRQ